MKNEKGLKYSIEEGVRIRNINGRGSFGYALNVLLSNPDMEIKLSALATIISSVLPNTTSEKLEKKLLNVDLEQLPLNLQENKATFIDKGLRSYIYKVETKQGLFVVKIEFAPPKATIDDVIYKATEDKENCDFLKKYYKSIESLIVDTDIIISKATRDNRLAIISIQKFLGEKLIDPFRYPKDKLINLLQKDEVLKKEFIDFVNLTKSINSKGVYIDLQGENNLCIVKEGRQNKLKFIDYGTVIFLNDENKSSKYDDFVNKELKFLSFLENIIQLIQDE